MDGELRIRVHDPDGRGVPAQIELNSRNPQFQTELRADQLGRTVLRRLPLGVYRLSVRHPGFQDFNDTVEIRSAVPHRRDVVLRLSVLATEVTVSDPAPLLDPGQPALIMRRGRQQLEQSLGTTLGRSTVDIVTTLPGWLLEANAVLHPRGSEYDTQYVIDGMPLYDNRSIAFAPALEHNEFENIAVMTAGIPAEYGRRLGGVIALDTKRIGATGHSSDAAIQAGSYSNLLGSLAHQYRTERTGISVGAHAGRTDRYLDPPSLENYTNEGTAAGYHARLDQDLSAGDRLSVYVRSNRTVFQVPNDLEQQRAGQRQDRSASETAGQIHYQHTFASHVLGSARGMVRDLTARLWSNPLATPVYVHQDRGFREGAILGNITVEGENHTLKFGGDFRINKLREQFQFAEPDELPELELAFADRRQSTEASAYVQDQFRVGNFAANIGLRLDTYRLMIQEHAFSPRVAVSYFVPRLDLLVRASYDRIFQPPPTENLLLSSAAPFLDIGEVEGSIAVPASRAHFFELGIRKPLWKTLRLDVSHYWRRFRNYIDDDVFLNTGLSFPITFDSARVSGTELRLEMPQWRNLSSFVSYSNMHGKASSPITGGLFLQGGEAVELRDTFQTFPITQDQRNTVAAQLRYEPHRRVWVTTGLRYGSGLPVELEADDDDDDNDDADEEDGNDGEGGGGDEQLIPEAILRRIDFERGRVRPNMSLDVSGGFRFWQRDSQSVTVQVDVRNVTDRLNVINFSGLFSGTALAPGRQATIQMRLRF